MSAGLNEASCLRRLTHEWIDEVVQMRRTYHTPLLSARNPGMPLDVIDNLHKICQLLIDTAHPFKLIVEFGNIRLYTNDAVLFDQLLAVGHFIFVNYKQAVVDRVRDTVTLKNPQHQYRSYFSRAKLTDPQKQSIVQFLNNNRDDFRLSPCLADWISQPFKWTEPYYFIDHNDTACLTMLSLINSRLIKKTNTIVQG
jgi:hypothetical protein